MTILSLDFDHTLMLESGFNKEMLPFLLWSQVKKIPIYITTRRNPVELLDLMTLLNYQTSSIEYCLSIFRNYGLLSPKIVTFYDPVEPEYFQNKIKEYEKQIIKLTPEIRESIKEAFLKTKKEQDNLTDQQVYAIEMPKNKEYQKKRAEFNNEQQRLEKIYTDKCFGVYKDDNKFKLEQLRYVHHMGGEANSIKTIHLDDDDKIINRLNEAKNRFDPDNKFLNNVYPIHYDQADKQNVWQINIAKELDLKQAAEKALKNKSFEKVETDLNACLAILLYLHQNKNNFGLNQQVLADLNDFTVNFSKKFVKFDSMRLTDDMCAYLLEVTGVSFAKPTIFSGFFNAAGNLLKEIITPPPSPEKKVPVGEKVELGKMQN